MSCTPTNSRTIPAPNPTVGLRLTTASNSYNARAPRSPKKSKNAYESGLSLKRIIGTTVTSPTGFDSLPSSRIFAYTAGAAAVVVTLDDELQYSQKFYRARPTTLPLISSNFSATTPSTPIHVQSTYESKNRAIASLRESGIGYSPSTPSNTSQTDRADSPSSKTWSSRERIKAATSLSLSRDGRFIAVGETGYSPRVLVFSLHESSDRPLVILNEHTFGVRAVAFSPDGRYLASLGNVNDGFIYIWAINTRNGAARLHASNKCTSFIKGMCWMGNNLITVGTRHVKVWRVEEPSVMTPSKQKLDLPGTPSPVSAGFGPVRTLSGRNSLLGALVDTTFTCVAPISDSTAIICSDRGDICLLDDDDGQRLMRVAQAGFPITCLAADHEAKNVRVGGRQGMTKLLSFDDLGRPSTPGDGQTPEREIEDCNSSSPVPSLGPACLIALSFIADVLVTVDSHHAIRMFHREEIIPHTSAAPLTAHHDPVLGVRLLNCEQEQSSNLFGNSTFFTWSASGRIIFWDLEGRKQHSFDVELERPLGEDEPSNQCQVVRASRSADFFVIGDKLGMLAIIDSTTGSRSFQAKAHTAEILDIAVFESQTTVLIASCSRDRTVQLFRRTETSWNLIQTLDEHTASVCSLFFCEKGQKLISASSDRTIQIRQILTKEINGEEVMAAIPLRVVTCKASPVSMVLTCNDDMAQSFVVSMLDRTISIYEIETGRLMNFFKATDSDGTEAVVMDALVMGSAASSNRPSILAGVSSTDKSVRVYDADNCTFLDREWGHTAAVTDVVLLESNDGEDRTTLISTGSDGTIMIWDLSPKVTPEFLEPADVSGMQDESPPKEIVSARPPLRRVLSKQELAAFQNTQPSTPTGRLSPPRSLRRKGSKYSMTAAQSPKLGPPPVPAVPTNYFAAGDISTSKVSGTPPRARSRSPPASPRRTASRRPSLASLEVRGRTKSAGPASEFGSLNMATEQVCRTLRAYRKKLATSESIREDSLKELDHELRMTAKAVGEKTLRNKAISETVLAGLLDQYSERLVSIFDEKLRLSVGYSGKATSPGPPLSKSTTLMPTPEETRRERKPSVTRRVSSKD